MTYVEPGNRTPTLNLTAFPTQKNCCMPATTTGSLPVCHRRARNVRDCDGAAAGRTCLVPSLNSPSFGAFWRGDDRHCSARTAFWALDRGCWRDVGWLALKERSFVENGFDQSSRRRCCVDGIEDDDEKAFNTNGILPSGDHRRAKGRRDAGRRALRNLRPGTRQALAPGPLLHRQRELRAAGRPEQQARRQRAPLRAVDAARILRRAPRGDRRHPRLHPHRRGDHQPGRHLQRRPAVRARQGLRERLQRLHQRRAPAPTTTSSTRTAASSPTCAPRSATP